MESNSYKMHATIVKTGENNYETFLHNPGKINFNDTSKDYICMGTFDTFDGATANLMRGIEIIEIKFE